MYNTNELRIIQALQKSVESELNRLGLLYRVFSRTKTETSINAKKNKDPQRYGASGKKIQDLFGIRIVLYFPDDLMIAQAAIQKIYDMDSKTVDESSTDLFSATRCNYIFKIPENLVNESKLLRRYDFIDSTFEVQFRTILSEGWHEVEHDLRYKCKEDWVNHGDLSRALNGIYASLETSDWGIMKLFEELSYRNYKSSTWSAMLRNKFRIRTEEVIEPSIIELINSKKLGKSFYRINREKLLLIVLYSEIDIPINLNNLVYLCNHFFIKNADITEITPKLLNIKFLEAEERYASVVMK